MQKPPTLIPNSSSSTVIFLSKNKDMRAYITEKIALSLTDQEVLELFTKLQ